jgi:hypothetical protein
LDVAEDRFIRIVVRTSLGQTGPLQPQSPHHRPRHPGFDRMRRIAIQGQPHGLPRIPPPHPPQESADIRGPLAGVEGPVDAAMIHVVEQEQVEPPAGLLVPLQDQPLGGGVTSAAVCLDRDGLDIEEGEDGTARTMLHHHARSRCRITRRLGSLLTSLRRKRRRLYPPFSAPGEGAPG